MRCCSVVASAGIVEALQHDEVARQLDPAQRWPFLLLLLQHGIVQLFHVLQVCTQWLILPTTAYLTPARTRPTHHQDMHRVFPLLSMHAVVRPM